MVALPPHREADDSNVTYNNKKKRKKEKKSVIILYGKLTRSDDTISTGYHSLKCLDNHQVPSLPGDWVGIMDGEGVTLAW